METKQAVTKRAEKYIRGTFCHRVKFDALAAWRQNEQWQNAEKYIRGTFCHRVKFDALAAWRQNEQWQNVRNDTLVAHFVTPSSATV